MATELSTIGKNQALVAIFEGSGFRNEYPSTFEVNSEVSHIQKLFIENIDFDLTYTPLRHLGYKLSQNVIGEIAAKGGETISLSFAVAISNRFGFEDIKELWEGVTAAAKEYSVRHLGLDLLPSATGMLISISGCGTHEKGEIEKKQVASNDLILITGDLGAAYMGLHVLEREKIAFNSAGAGAQARQPDLTSYKYILEQYLSPHIPVNLNSRFKEAGVIPSAGYFITRGLGSTIKELCQEHGVGARIFLEKIPIASKTFEMAQELDIDPVTSAINGGDDYRFLFVVPLSQHEIYRKDFQDFEMIGFITGAEKGSVIVTPEGAELEIKAQGF